MIFETIYKNRPALCLESPDISVIVLPFDGGKIASIKAGEMELIYQRDTKNYKRLFMDTKYTEGECSGFDDMFPTIDSCRMNGFDYPDHGEVCRKPFSYDVADDKINLSCTVESVNAFYSKTLYVKDEKLYIYYKIENKNECVIPYVWAGHIMLKGEEGASVVSAYGDEVSITPSFGILPAKEKLTTLQFYGAHKEYKFYYDEPKENLKCSVLYPGSRMQLDFEIVTGDVRYLGVWMNPGDLNGMYNLAIEPCTAPYDSPPMAEQAEKCSYIQPNSSVEFTLCISLKNNI